MIDFRPHFIAFKESDAPIFDDNGNPVFGGSAWGDPMPCRYESDGKSNIQVLKDGSIKAYAYVVYMEPTGKTFDGRIARLFDSERNVVCEALIHHSISYQLSTVLYIEKCLSQETE